MLKSSARTNEVPVMGAEEWAQVIVCQSKSINRNKDYEQDKKEHFPEKEVMPYACRESRKTAMH